MKAVAEVAGRLKLDFVRMDDGQGSARVRTFVLFSKELPLRKEYKTLYIAGVHRVELLRFESWLEKKWKITDHRNNRTYYLKAHEFNLIL